MPQGSQGTAPPSALGAIAATAHALEREADNVAAQVMRMPAPISANLPIKPTARPARGGDSSPPAAAPLSPALRAFFEPRFGHDFSAVRVHADGAAAQSARALQARAYTQGRDVVFGAGEYAPGTPTGQQLIAHELAHVVQQASGRASGAQTKLTVDAKASDDPATAVATVQPLVAALCPDFGVAASGGVSPAAGSDSAGFKFAKVATGKQPLGCCCLSTLTAAPAAWTIVVRGKDAPLTVFETRVVAITPPGGGIALRHWTSAAPTETLQALPPAEAFGHELCGHAALMQIAAHPSTKIGASDRAYNDEHDPTVRIENALATEMGLPGARRGLAAGGGHRGESVRVISIGPYAADADDPAPFAKQTGEALKFLEGDPTLLNGSSSLLIDVVGLRDANDTKPSVSQTRADKIAAVLKAGLITTTVTIETTPGKPETLNRLQPITDGGLGAAPVVELRMAVRPAGLIKPIGAAPPAAPVHVEAEHPAVVKAHKAGKGPNACHALLSNSAWP